VYPHSCEKWILKLVGRDWRQYNAALKKAYFNVKKKKYVLYRQCPEDVSMKINGLGLSSNGNQGRAR
jgi:hypothetical protein